MKEWRLTNLSSKIEKKIIRINEEKISQEKLTIKLRILKNI